MAEESFILRYDGPALEAHTIDVADLAEALIGLNEFIQEGNRLVGGGQVAPITVKIKATDPGCFQIEIALIQTFYEKAVSLLSGNDATALANLLGILGLGGAITMAAGVVELVRRLRGRKPRSIAPGPTPGTLQITLADGSTLIVQSDAWRLAESPRVRAPLQRVVRPLERDGVNTLEVISQPRRERLARIEKADVASFEPPPEVLEELPTLIRDTYVHIVSMWFRGDDNKWRFSEGDSDATFTAAVKDQEFLEQVLRDEVSFQSSDLLKVRLKQAQYRLGDSLKSEYEVEKVLERIKGVRQTQLLLPSDPKQLDAPNNESA